MTDERKMSKARWGVAFGILALFVISVFTKYPVDPITRGTLHILTLGAAGFVLGPAIVGKEK